MKSAYHARSGRHRRVPQLNFILVLFLDALLITASRSDLFGQTSRAFFTWVGTDIGLAICEPCRDAFRRVGGAIGWVPDIAQYQALPTPAVFVSIIPFERIPIL